MSETQKFKTRDLIVGLVATVSMTVASWGMKTDRDLRSADAAAAERLSVIESTQFTDDDAAQVFAPGLERVLSKIEHLGEKIGDLKEENKEIREAIQEVADRM